MSSEVSLSFAIVGHPNEGKSSVVSTLAEDDSVRITPIPGETVVCQTFPVIIDDWEIIRFVDTPGFQSPLATLSWLRENDGPDMLERFIRAHKQDSRFSGECELFTPLVSGSGIIYVVDASRPLRSTDIAEMEVLRMTGIPRMAIINNKDETNTYLDSWREELRKHFNSIRVFNAHMATYAERIALLESLKAIDQQWEDALAWVIRAFQDDWSKRNEITALIICDMIETCLRYQTKKHLTDDSEFESVKQKFSIDFQKEIARIEKKAHNKIKKLFKHNIFDYSLPEQSIAGEDLFQEKTWQVLGLTPWQLAAAGAAAGGGLGLGLDAATAGITFGVFTLSGAIVGAGSALMGGRRAARSVIKSPGFGRFQISGRIGGHQLILGPVTNIQFPFILLDRALILYTRSINWAHGRRGRKDQDSPQGDDKSLVSTLSTTQRGICSAFFQHVRSNNEKKYERSRQDMANMLKKVFSDISHSKIM